MRFFPWNTNHSNCTNAVRVTLFFNVIILIIRLAMQGRNQFNLFNLVDYLFNVYMRFFSLEHESLESYEYRAECVCSTYLEYHKYLRIVCCVDPCDALKKYHDCTENVRFELTKNLLFQVFC